MCSNVSHDHVYLSSFHPENESKRPKIRKKSDIQTDEDQKEYYRRRSLNNASCRISRLHRRSKFNSILEKCQEYEHSNRQLQMQRVILDQVVERLKEHLRSLVSQSSD